MKAYNSRNYFSMSLYKYNLKLFGLSYYNLDWQQYFKQCYMNSKSLEILLTEAPLKGRDFPALLRKIIMSKL